MEEGAQELLMIFVRNPRLGAVKTRLAKAIGDRKALSVYRVLLEQTRSVALDMETDRAIFYTEEVEGNDLFDPSAFQKYQQRGADLGERMAGAFRFAFDQGYQRVVIMGSDCIELTSGILREAFRHLHSRSVVLGPARDGGYYLLGMNQYIDLFRNKAWSTENVFLDTLSEVKAGGHSYALMPTLSDLDDLEDLQHLKKQYDQLLS